MKDKKLIIAVLCGGGDDVLTIKDAADNTWNSLNCPNVQTIFFKGGNEESIIGNVYCSGTSDDWYQMHVVFKQFLKYIWNWEWDYILHGGISSYFNKEKCYTKILTLPEERCYCGMKLPYYDYGYASGSSFFISRDVAKILIEHTPDTEICEDVLYGIVLNKFDIGITPGAERVEGPNIGKGLKIGQKLTPCYHYRCKEDSPENRLQVIDKFNYVHNYILNQKESHVNTL